MISKLSYKIADFLCSKDVILLDEKEVYQYGYEIFLDGVIDTVVLLIAGMVTRKLTATLIFVIVFAGTRMFCGGYHANAKWKCKVITIVCWSVCVWLCGDALYVKYTYRITALIAIWSTFLLLAPVDNVNKRLSKQEKRINRYKSILVLSIATIIVVLSGYRQISNVEVILNTLMIISVLMIIAKITKGGKQYED